MVTKNRLLKVINYYNYWLCLMARIYPTQIGRQEPRGSRLDRQIRLSHHDFSRNYRVNSINGFLVSFDVVHFASGAPTRLVFETLKLH